MMAQEVGRKGCRRDVVAHICSIVDGEEAEQRQDGDPEGNGRQASCGHDHRDAGTMLNGLDVATQARLGG